MEPDDDWDAAQETQEILRDPDVVAAILAAKAEPERNGYESSAKEEMLALIRQAHASGETGRATVIS